MSEIEFSSVVEKLGDNSTAIVISAPHGGKTKPEGVSRRKQGCVVSDFNSDRLAAELRLVLNEKLQANVALVSAKWHRSRCDMNRSLDLAAECQQAHEAWHFYHGALSDALQAAVDRHGFALLLDIHGQSHRAVTELGYCLSSASLMLSDDALNECYEAGNAVCSIRTVVDASPMPLSEWIRGDSSFGAHLQRHGFFSVPSPMLPNPEAQPIRVLASSKDGLAVVASPQHDHVHKSPSSSQIKLDRAIATAAMTGVAHGELASIVNNDDGDDDDNGQDDDDSLRCCRFAAASCCCSIYFSGGYTTRHHSASIAGVSAIQIETPFAVRRCDELRQSFANAIALSAIDFIDRQKP